jgi:amino acid permease
MKTTWIGFQLWIIIGLLVFSLYGCAAVGYVGSVASAAGAIKSELQLTELEDRVKALEDGDIWQK